MKIMILPPLRHNGLYSFPPATDKSQSVSFVRLRGYSPVALRQIVNNSLLQLNISTETKHMEASSAKGQK